MESKDSIEDFSDQNVILVYVAKSFESKETKAGSSYEAVNESILSGDQSIQNNNIVLGNYDMAILKINSQNLKR